MIIISATKSSDFDDTGLCILTIVTIAQCLALLFELYFYRDLCDIQCLLLLSLIVVHQVLFTMVCTFGLLLSLDNK